MGKKLVKMPKSVKTFDSFNAQQKAIGCHINSRNLDRPPCHNDKVTNLKDDDVND